MRKNSLLTLVLLLFSVPLPAQEVPPGYREVARQENVPAEALYSPGTDGVILDITGTSPAGR